MGAPEWEGLSNKVGWNSASYTHGVSTSDPLDIYIKKAIGDFENLKISQLSWKNISKFTVASGFSQMEMCSGAEYLLPSENPLQVNPRNILYITNTYG